MRYCTLCVVCIVKASYAPTPNIKIDTRDLHELNLNGSRYVIFCPMWSLIATAKNQKQLNVTIHLVSFSHLPIYLNTFSGCNDFSRRFFVFLMFLQTIDIFIETCPLRNPFTYRMSCNRIKHDSFECKNC